MPSILSNPWVSLAAQSANAIAGAEKDERDQRRKAEREMALLNYNERIKAQDRSYESMENDRRAGIDMARDTYANALGSGNIAAAKAAAAGLPRVEGGPDYGAIAEQQGADIQERLRREQDRQNKERMQRIRDQAFAYTDPAWAISYVKTTGKDEGLAEEEVSGLVEELKTLESHQRRQEDLRANTLLLADAISGNKDRGTIVRIAAKGLTQEGQDIYKEYLAQGKVRQNMLMKLIGEGYTKDSPEWETAMGSVETPQAAPPRAPGPYGTPETRRAAYADAPDPSAPTDPRQAVMQARFGGGAAPPTAAPGGFGRVMSPEGMSRDAVPGGVTSASMRPGLGANGVTGGVTGASMVPGPGANGAAAASADTTLPPEGMSRNAVPGDLQKYQKYVRNKINPETGRPFQSVEEVAAYIAKHSQTRTQ